MWRARYEKIYKTHHPNFVITAVCNFPNINDTLEKNIEYYEVKKLQKDPKLLDVYADYYSHNGNSFIPLYFADDIPKLEKLQILQPLGKGWFWCVGYKLSKNFGDVIQTYEWYTDHLNYMLKKHFSKNNGIIQHLFKQTIKYWVYSNTPNSMDDFCYGEISHRRFDVIENKRFTVETDNFEPKDYRKYILKMKTTNWYEFIFYAFK